VTDDGDGSRLRIIHFPNSFEMKISRLWSKRDVNSQRGDREQCEHAYPFIADPWLSPSGFMPIALISWSLAPDSGSLIGWFWRGFEMDSDGWWGYLGSV
jgi:hypothetical protein